jgi:S-DNA-T family DNA segregation ATPase FtsK/SpoIIIE
VRTHICDIPTLRKIVARGRELRVKAGTLTGMAAGDDLVEEEPARNVLDDVHGIFAVAESKLWNETIASRLAARWPEHYDGWTAADVSGVLAKHGVKTVQVWGQTPDGESANRRGITLEGFIQAIADRPDGSEGR